MRTGLWHMRILFVNSAEPRCGVAQYGANLCEAIASVHPVHYASYNSEIEFRHGLVAVRPDVVIYNWQAGIGGWMQGAPFRLSNVKQVFVYHDLEARFNDFDAILFSDPTMKPHDNWHPIGRPLRPGVNYPQPPDDLPIIGLNGFIGAWGLNVIQQAAREYGNCLIRMHLPYAAFGDMDGNLASGMASQCVAAMPKGFKWQINHEFLPWDDLVKWLAGNHINCYLRDVGMNWRGVSSATDAALCARRPIAINGCNAFRHLHDCSPSIKVEDSSIREIICNGLSPLNAKYAAYAPEVVGNQVMKVLESVV